MAEVVAKFLELQETRSVLLSEEFDEFGVGIVAGAERKGVYYLTLVFAKRKK